MQDAHPLEPHAPFDREATELLDPRAALAEDVVHEGEVGVRPSLEDVRDLFASLGDRSSFLFASGCNTSPRTPFANLLAFRDAAFKHGQFTSSTQ